MDIIGTYCWTYTNITLYTYIYQEKFFFCRLSHWGHIRSMVNSFTAIAPTESSSPAISFPDVAWTLLDPNNGGLLKVPPPPPSRSRFLCLQCLSYRMPNSTIKYSTSARNTNSVHDISHTSMHFSSSALGELFLHNGDVKTYSKTTCK